MEMEADEGAGATVGGRVPAPEAAHPSHIRANPGTPRARLIAHHPGHSGTTVVKDQGLLTFVTPMARPRLLVVDDNLELLSLLTHLFEDAGYDVVSASKGKQALEVARGHSPALAVLDVLLPDIMGYHLAVQLRKEFPQLPIIFITGVFKGGKH